MRILYNLLTYFLLIPYTIYWLLRALVNNTYRHKLAQRFGFGYQRLEPSLWVHAVSVGEVVAAAPLIRALLERYPEHPVLLTTVTPTGAARCLAMQLPTPIFRSKRRMRSTASFGARSQESR